MIKQVSEFLHFSIAPVHWVICLIAFVAGIIAKNIFITAFFAALLFALFDAVGHGYGVKIYNLPPVLYRVLQVCMHIMLGIITAMVSWVALVMFLTLWWFAFCDLMYYVYLGKMDQIRDTIFSQWMWWTPAGLLKIEINFTVLLIQVWTGVGICLTLGILSEIIW